MADFNKALLKKLKEAELEERLDSAQSWKDKGRATEVAMQPIDVTGNVGIGMGETSMEDAASFAEWMRKEKGFPVAQEKVEQPSVRASTSMPEQDEMNARRAFIEDMRSAQVDRQEEKRLEGMALKGQKLQDLDIKANPEVVTFGKQFVQDTIPEDLQGRVLKKYAEMKEEDLPNADARISGSLLGMGVDSIPLSGGSKGAVSSMVRDMIERQGRGRMSQRGALELIDLPKEEKQKAIETINVQLKDIGNRVKEKGLTPELLDQATSTAREMLKVKANKPSSVISEMTQVVKGPDGKYHEVIGEVETHLPFDVLKKGRGSNAIMLDDGTVMMPTEEAKRKIVLQLEEDDPKAYAELMNMGGQTGAIRWKQKSTPVDTSKSSARTVFQDIKVDPETGERTIVYAPELKTGETELEKFKRWLEEQAKKKKSK